MKYLINLSGHMLSPEAHRGLDSRFDGIETIAIDAIDFNKSVEDQMKNLFAQVKTTIDGSVAVTVILPGHSVLAALVVVYLHGTLGHFPSICLLQSSESGPYVPTNIFYIDAKDVRSSGREFRQELIKSNPRL
jgi:hypothetical protein